MPIKGLSDRGLAFPEIGAIRKGAKKEANKPGADLVYFRVEFDEMEKKAAADFKAAYAQQYEKHGGPQAIRILFPFNEIERMWDPWLEAYTAGRLVARSDGEFITYQLDDKGEVIVHGGKDANGNPVPHPANGIAGKDYKGNPVKFKPTGRLKVIVPEIKRAAYLTVMTTSTHDIGNISSQLAAFKELNGGQLAGIPFILRRKPKAISTPSDNGQRVRRIKWLIAIEVDPDWAQAKFGQLNAMALPPGIDMPAAPADVPDTEDVIEFDEDEIIEEVGAVEGEETLPAREIIDTLGDWAVTEAGKFWNISKADAAKEIGKAKLGKLEKSEFMEWLKNPASQGQATLI